LDTYKYHKAVAQPDWDQFQENATKALRTLEGMGIWKDIFEMECKIR
jgi:hypothetical protein